MSNWIHTYAPGEIGDGSTITEHTPGMKIAEAITEIQEKAATSVEIEIAGYNVEASIEGNNLVIRATLQEKGLSTGEGLELGGGGVSLPSGGTQYQVLQRNSVGVAVWDWLRIH